MYSHEYAVLYQVEATDAALLLLSFKTTRFAQEESSGTTKSECELIIGVIDKGYLSVPYVGL